MIKWLLDTVGGEEDRHDKNKLGILYDIGCNIEKGIKKVSFVNFIHLLNLFTL